MPSPRSPPAPAPQTSRGTPGKAITADRPARVAGCERLDVGHEQANTRTRRHVRAQCAQGVTEHQSVSCAAPDVTLWRSWFLECLLRAVQGADGLLVGVLDKAQFWQRWAGTPMNQRQTLVLNRVLDGMEGKLTNARWAAMAKCLADTALRDINDLLARGVMRKLEGGGGVRGMSYVSNRLLAGAGYAQEVLKNACPLRQSRKSCQLCLVDFESQKAFCVKLGNNDTR